MMTDAGLPAPPRVELPPDWDGERNWTCAAPATVTLLLWDASATPEITVCLTHALGAALSSLATTPKIKGVRPVRVAGEQRG